MIIFICIFHEYFRSYQNVFQNNIPALKHAAFIFTDQFIDLASAPYIFYLQWIICFLQTLSKHHKTYFVHFSLPLILSAKHNYFIARTEANKQNCLMWKTSMCSHTMARQPWKIYCQLQKGKRSLQRSTLYSPI